MLGTTVERTTAEIRHTRRPVQQERARIARELHDTVSQTLYAITLGVCRARSFLQQNDGTEAQRIIEDVLQLANSGQSELRALLANIRSDQLTAGGLMGALEELAVDAQTCHGVDVRLSPTDEPDLPALTKEALVLIVREALHNVVKHARVSHAEITLRPVSGRLELTITDSGRGFDPTMQRPGHFGLQSMRERAAAVGGTFALVSAIGLGTRIRVCVPLPADADG